MQNALIAVGVKRIITAFDCDSDELTKQANKFASQLQHHDTAIVYFAGHGVEFQNDKRLLTTMANDDNFSDHSLRVEQLILRSYDACACVCA